MFPFCCCCSLDCLESGFYYRILEVVNRSGSVPVNGIETYSYDFFKNFSTDYIHDDSLSTFSVHSDFWNSLWHKLPVSDYNSLIPSSRISLTWNQWWYKYYNLGILKYGKPTLLTQSILTYDNYSPPYEGNLRYIQFMRI